MVGTPATNSGTPCGRWGNGPSPLSSDPTPPRGSMSCRGVGLLSYYRLAQSQPPSGQGFRADHRLGDRMAVHRFNPALHPPSGKVMLPNGLVSNPTLTLL